MSEIGKFQPGPSQEHFKKFQIESRTNSPDIRMQLDPNASDFDPRRLDALLGAGNEENRRFTRRRPEFATSLFLDHVINPQGHDREKSISKEELAKEYEQVGSYGEAQIAQIVNLVERRTPPWPYNSRGQEMYFDSTRSDIEAVVIREEASSEDKRPWIYRTAADREQQEATMHILFAMGGSIPGYYDVLAQLQALMSRERYQVNFDDYVSAFSENDPGLNPDLTMNEEERQKFREKLEGRAREGLRSEILLKQDEFRLLSMGIVAVAQWDCEEFPGKETFMPLHPNQLRFIRLLYGDIDETKWVTYVNKEGRSYKIPKEIEGWFHTGDDVEKRRRYEARGIAFLKKAAERKSGDTFWKQLESMSPEQILQIAQEIETEAQQIIKKWKDPFKDVSRRISERVIKFWTSHDLAFLTAGELAWGFEYSEQNGSVKRKIEEGGTHKAYDSISGVYWFRRKHKYEEGLKSAANFLSATDQQTRLEVMRNKPGWTPDINKYRKTDPFLDNVLKFLFDPSMERTRKEILAGANAPEDKINKTNGNFDPVISQRLQENMYAWVVPYQGPNGEKLAFPMFFPAKLEELNFLRYIKVDNGRTVWDELRAGKRMSQINLQKSKFDTVDHYWVSMNMLLRFLKIMIDPTEAEKDPSINAFFASASTQNERELAKRILLGFRNTPKEAAWLVPALLPYAVSQFVANSRGIMGSESINDPAVVTNYVEDMSKWIQAFKWLPQVMAETFPEEKVGGEIVNYGNEMALLATGYMMQFLHIGQVAFGQNTPSSQATFDVLKQIVNGDTSLGKVFDRGNQVNNATLKVNDRILRDVPERSPLKQRK